MCVKTNHWNENVNFIKAHNDSLSIIPNRSSSNRSPDPNIMNCLSRFMIFHLIILYYAFHCSSNIYIFTHSDPCASGWVKTGKMPGLCQPVSSVLSIKMRNQKTQCSLTRRRTFCCTFFVSSPDEPHAVTWNINIEEWNFSSLHYLISGSRGQSARTKFRFTSAKSLIDALRCAAFVQ